jgi:hypothetical protein
MPPRAIIACLLVGAFVNATPSFAAFHPQTAISALVEDDLVGSGYETDGAKAHQQAIKRLGSRRPRLRGGEAANVLKSARDELLRREPGLGIALVAAFSRMYRDDAVGTVIRSGDSIRFNRTYVLSLSREELLDHMWQLAVSLQSRY